MRISRFQGEPAIEITERGANMTFKGGQPVMDQGLNNAVLISLFTAPGWWGNTLMESGQKIGSRFYRPRTLIDIQSVNEIRRDAEIALKWMTDTGLATRVTVEAGTRNEHINTQVNIFPPGQGIQKFLFTNNGQKWVMQAVNPAHERL